MDAFCPNVSNAPDKMNNEDHKKGDTDMEVYCVPVEVHKENDNEKMEVCYSEIPVMTENTPASPEFSVGENLNLKMINYQV